MSAAPRVDRLVLYKHGVAYVGRSGRIDGDFDLTFRRDDMKDVLKSLSVEIADGDATVVAVAFDTPSDPRAELADRNLLMSSDAALLDLLDGLRGRLVEVVCGNQRHRGEVIGVDDSGQDGARRLLLLRTETGRVSLVDLSTAEDVQLLEDPSRDDLSYLIDRSRAASAGRDCQVAVRVGGGPAQARVSYIVPAPMWRVSYRLSRGDGGLVLAAMGIVHNPIDEDLTEVTLTLTTGQPISFDIDLYHGRQVQRTVIEETERVAAAPPERRMRAMAAPVADAAMPAPTGAYAAYAEAADDVVGEDRGEHFEYRLSAPVSIKRGGAAMVPLVVAPVDDVQRELVWRAGAPAPDVMLTFTNSTGVVLEEGPAVVYEDGGYSGEAMLDFTARGAGVRLAFAKDLAVRCSRRAHTDVVTVRVRLAAEAVVEEQRCEQRHILAAENDHDEAVEVIFEVPSRSGREFRILDDGVVDAGRTADARWRRFRVSVPGHQRLAVSVVETWPIYTEVDYHDLAPDRLQEWLSQRALDAETIKALSGVLGHWERATALEARREGLDAERDEVYTAQSRLAEQLRVLTSEGAEGQLRQRQVAELERLQDRVGELDRQISELRTEAETARHSASAELRRLIDQSG